MLASVIFVKRRRPISLGKDHVGFVFPTQHITQDTGASLVNVPRPVDVSVVS